MHLALAYNMCSHTCSQVLNKTSYNSEGQSLPCRRMEPRDDCYVEEGVTIDNRQLSNFR